MQYFIKKFQEITQSFVRIIQKKLIAIFLTIIYIGGFGITLVFMIGFKRNDNDTFWNKAVGYKADVYNSMRQS